MPIHILFSERTKIEFKLRFAVPADNSGVWVYSVEVEKKWEAKFDVKQYMSPIPQEVIDQNPKIEQNPGY